MTGFLTSCQTAGLARLRRASFTVAAAGALLALTVGAAVAAPDAQGILRCAGGTPAASLAQEFADGPRLPLSAIGISAGVIVVTNSRNVNIVRRDGSEMRLKGSLPGDSPTADAGKKPLVRSNEVWVRAEDLPELLGRTCTCDATVTTVARDMGGASAQFDTFEVPSPTVVKPAPKPTPVWRPRQLPSLQASDDQGKSWIEVTPVEMSLSLSRIGGIATPDLRGSFQETLGGSPLGRTNRGRNLDPSSPVSRVLSYVAIEAEEGSRHYRAGDSYDPLFGWGTGIGFTTPVSSTMQLGATVIAPGDLPGQATDGQVALQAHLSPQQAVSLETEISGDGSYHAQARVSKPGLSLVSSVLNVADRQQQAIWWQKHLWSGLALVGRVSSSAGEYELDSQALGLRWDRGPWHVTGERDRAVVEGEETAASSVSALWMQRDLFAALRYVARDAAGGPSGFEWTISRTDPSGKQISLSSLGPRDGGTAYRLGASLPLNRDLQARASLEWGPGGARPEYKLEWKRSRDQMMVLRYGAAYWDDRSAFTKASADRVWEPEPAVALYGNLAFGRTGASGLEGCDIAGSVKDDAGEGVPDVVLLLDDATQAVTRADGTFQFIGIEDGLHRVRLDPSRLRADLGSNCRPNTVVAAPGTPAQVEFLVVRLCEIGGETFVTPIAADGSAGEPEPLAGVQVECRSARALQGEAIRATTDDHGRYLVTGLKPGRYVISLTEGQAFGRLTLTPPSEWTFALQAGEKVSGANFVFQRRERAVIFTDVMTSSQ